MAELMREAVMDASPATIFRFRSRTAAMLMASSGRATSISSKVIAVPSHVAGLCEAGGYCFAGVTDPVRV